MLKLRFGDASTCFPSLLHRFLNADRYKQRQRELVLSKQIASKAAVCVVGSQAMIHDLLTMRHGIGADIICARFNYSLEAYLLKRLFIPLDLVLCAQYAYFISTYMCRSVACDTTEESVCVFVHTNDECGCVLVGLVVHTQDTSMKLNTDCKNKRTTTTKVYITRAQVKYALVDAKTRFKPNTLKSPPAVP